MYGKNLFVSDFCYICVQIKKLSCPPPPPHHSHPSPTRSPITPPAHPHCPPPTCPSTTLVLVLLC